MTPGMSDSSNSHPGRQRAIRKISVSPPQLDIPYSWSNSRSTSIGSSEIRPVDRGGEVLEKLPFECHKDKIAAVETSHSTDIALLVRRYLTLPRGTRSSPRYGRWRRSRNLSSATSSRWRPSGTLRRHSRRRRGKPFARRTGPGQCGERTQGAQQRRSLYADAYLAKWHAGRPSSPMTGSARPAYASNAGP